MNLLRSVFQAEWLNLSRSGLLRWGAGLLLLAGVYALLHGRTEITRQQRTATLLRQDEQARHDTLRAQQHLDTTVAAHRARRADALDPYFWDVQGYRYAVHSPSPLAPFSLGQRDLFPTYQDVMGRALQRQLNPSEISNPQKLLVGSFDLAFVLVYLLPLFIIALTYNVLSAEREGGTLALLRVQGASLRSVVGAKLLFRAALVAGGVVVLTALGLLFLPDAPSATLLGGWLAVALAYTVFWFGLAWAVVALGRSSAVSAMLLLSAWLVLVLALPALVQQVLTNTHPLPDRSVVQRLVREEYNVLYRKQPDFEVFYAQYPALRGSDTTNAERYNLMKYYARNEALDQAIAPTVARQSAQQVTRQRAVAALTPWLPALNAQELFNQLAGTDDRSREAFLAQVGEFHAQWKAFFITRKFQGTPMTAADIAQLPTFTYRPVAPAGVGTGVGWLLLGGAIWVAVGAGLARRTMP